MTDRKQLGDNNRYFVDCGRVGENVPKEAAPTGITREYVLPVPLLGGHPPKLFCRSPQSTVIE